MHLLFAYGVPDAMIGRVDATDIARGVALPGNMPLLDALAAPLAERGWTYQAALFGQQALPQGRFDVVFNCICEPTLHQQSLRELLGFVLKTGIPVLNHPWAIAATGRAMVSYLLAHQAGVTVPHTTRWRPGTASLAEHVATHAHHTPVLLRPVGRHGGHALRRIENVSQSGSLESDTDYFVTDFIDYASDDGLYRKYREIYVGDRLFRRHLVITDDWAAHGRSRECMLARAELRAEEQAFINGASAPFEDALRHQFRALRLDFGAVDFTRDAGGITIFEINACFQLSGSIPPAYQQQFGYLEQTNPAVCAALLDHAARQAARRR